MSVEDLAEDQQEAGEVEAVRRFQKPGQPRRPGMEAPVVRKSPRRPCRARTCPAAFLLHDQPYDQQVVYGIHPVGQDKIADVALAGVPGQRQERGEEQEPRHWRKTPREPVRSSQRRAPAVSAPPGTARRRRCEPEPGTRRARREAGLRMCSRGGAGARRTGRTDLQRAAQQPVGGAWQAEQAGERRTRQPNEDEAGQPDQGELEGYLCGHLSADCDGVVYKTDLGNLGRPFAAEAAGVEVFVGEIAARQVS